MSFEAVTWALDAKCSGTDKVVLIGIASHADKYGDNAWPSLATLAGYACVSTRSVQTAIANLVKFGYVSVVSHGGGPRDFRGDRRPNLYRLDGMKPASPRSCHDTKLSAQRHEAQRAHGVKPASTEPSIEPSKNRPVMRRYLATSKDPWERGMAKLQAKADQEGTQQ